MLSKRNLTGPIYFLVVSPMPLVTVYLAGQQWMQISPYFIQISAQGTAKSQMWIQCQVWL